MLISHSKGLYTIMVNEERRIVYEAPIGEWKKTDYEEYQALYLNTIKPCLGEGEWALCTDLRKYRISEIEELIGNQIDWYCNNRMKCAALIVDSAMIKVHISKIISNKFNVMGFLDEADAEQWLKSLGF